ncbi:MAG TPA: glycosyltransferase family 4 protein [Spirochaetota bacterium]|nr:glycosyltransferase family 4 protein [Spirochaetota bacterium]HNT10966.1 glycosyltransferase family 4 protein [Spirochaetota bacterium]
MRVLWLTTRHAPQTGGMAQSSSRLVNSLRDRAHRVAVLHLAPDVPDDATRAESLIRCDAADLREPERIFWKHRDAIADSLLVGFGGTIAGYLAALWARWAGAKSLVLFRGNDFDRALHNTKAAWMTHFILQHATIVGAVTGEMTERIRTIRTGPVIFTPNSADASQWLPLERDLASARRFRMERGLDGVPVVAMFGELKAKKGVDLACRIFDQLGLAERARLLTVGSLPEPIAALQADPARGYWIHVPFTAHDELPAWYAASDIVFIPSLYDGMPNVLLEAMAAGRIVAGSRAGGMPDVIVDGENGFLFDIADADDAARVINMILDMDDASKRAIAESARRTVCERFTAEREIAAIESALCEFADEPAGARS